MGTGVVVDTGAVESRTKRALLVGVNQYSADSGLAPLQTPRNDVAALARVLGDGDFCGFRDVIQLVDPDKQRLEEELNRLFVRAGKDDLIVFYFSGHGKLSEKGELHLCPTNTSAAYLFATALRLSSLRDLIDNFKTTQVVIVLDCCFSGAANAAFKGDIPSLLTAELAKGRGKYLITSSTAAQPSWGKPGEQYSLFTKWVLHGLEKRAADLNGDSTITLEELFRYVEQQVQAEEPLQHPQNFNFETSLGDVIIGRSQQARRRGITSPLPATDPDFFRAVEELTGTGRIIPFLGTGIYGSGPLSSFALATALADRAKLKTQEVADLAMAAEYEEQFIGDREGMLDVFQDILGAQSSQVKPRASHDMVLSMKGPALIVSATYDLLLERRLKEAGREFAIVSHILRSPGRESDGKILLLRYGTTVTAEVCVSDKILLDVTKDLIIYKVLGSPLLRQEAPGAEDLDTVVVTESDHMFFLGRLQNELMKVPDCFNRPFLKRSILYLGYSLDLWHYRLVLQVFGRRPKKSFAVRTPTSQIEMQCWTNLHSEMIRSDPEQFARSFIAGPTPAIAEYAGR